MFYKVAFFIAFVGGGGYLLYSLFKGKFKKKSNLSKVGLGFLSLILISAGFNIAGYNDQTNIADKTKTEIEQEVEDQDEIKEKEKIEEQRKAEEAKEKAAKEKADKEARELEEKKKAEEEEKQKEKEALESQNEKLEAKSNNVVQDTNNASSSGSQSSSQNSNNKPVQQKVEEVQPEPLTNSQNVYITKTGSKYHRGKCGRGNFFEVTLQEAQSRGLEPCSKCY